MCGESEDEKEASDLVARLARCVDINARRSTLAAGLSLDSEGLYAYMDRLFSDLVETAAADTVAAAPETRVDMARGQSVVLARAAGLMAASIGGEHALHAVMDALLHGYAAAKES
jgi:hypothetical protein